MLYKIEFWQECGCNWVLRDVTKKAIPDRGDVFECNQHGAQPVVRVRYRSQ